MHEDCSVFDSVVDKSVCDSEEFLSILTDVVANVNVMVLEVL